MGARENTDRDVCVCIECFEGMQKYDLFRRQACVLIFERHARVKS